MQTPQNLKDKKGGFWERYVDFACKFDWLMVLVCLVSITILLLYVMKIQIRSDFKEMLPDQFRSVIELNKIEKRVKSTGNLAVIVGGDDWPSMRRFANDLVFRAKVAMPDDIADIEYNVIDVRNFYDQNKYLYIDLPDLKEIYQRAKRQVDYEKVKRSPFYIDLGEEPAKFEISDIEEKYKSKTSNYQHYEDGYFTNKDVNLAVVLVKPREGSTNAAFAEHLISGLNKVVDDLNPRSYHPSIKIGYGGRYKKVIEQYQALISDLLTTIILCVCLVGLALFVYFKRLRLCAWSVIIVIQGVLITLAITRYSLGYLTSQTAFLGSIIVGNGINYGLIVLARYVEERRNDQTIREAIITSLSKTWRATIVSSLTTSGAFAVLALTKIKGFSQFGIIGGMGMLICWITTYIFLPSLVNLTERIHTLNVKRISLKSPYVIFGPLGRWVESHYKLVIRVSIIAIAASVGLISWYLPRSLEYDFSKLKFESVEEGKTWEGRARAQLAGIFGQSTTPSVILANSIEEVRPTCDSIVERVKKDGMEDIFDKCKTIYEFVPSDQDEKLKVLADMRELLSGSTLAFLTESQKREVDKFRETFNLKPIGLEDVPPEISANFEEVDGKRGLIAYVYSNAAANLWDGKNLIRFANLIREIKLPDGKTIYSSGEPVIFADLLQAVVSEGPQITFFSLVIVLIIVFLNFRRSIASVMIAGALITGVMWLVACLGIFNLKLNFLNFVALPISFGIGVDYAVNMYQRYKYEGKGSMARVTATTGAAVMLCSSTTIIGYSVLLISSSRALQSFGMVAVIGEFCCLAAALVSMPALVRYLEGHKITGHRVTN